MADYYTLERRYMEDPVFRRLVDFIYQWIAETNATPSEVRDAAMMAALKFEYTHMRSLILPPGGPIKFKP